MPVIRQYQSQIREQGPVQFAEATADQFGAQTSRAVGQLAQGVGQFTEALAKREEQTEISDLNAKMTKFNADSSIELQEIIRTAKPGDTKPFEQYQEKIDQGLSELGQNYSSKAARNYFTTTSAQIKAQMSKTSAAGQAELAGIKGVQDYQDSRNNLSSALLSDPSSYELQSQLHTQGIQNLVDQGLLPQAKADELKQDGEAALAKAAIRGWANLDPDYAKKKLKDGAFDKQLGAEGKVQLYGEVEQSIRAKEIEGERLKRKQEEIDKQNRMNTQNDFLSKMVKNELTADDILKSNLEAFGSGSKEQFLQLMKAQNQSDRLKTDASVMVNIFDKINLPDGDPNKITDENELNKYLGNGLSFTDLQRLRGEIQGKGTQAGGVEADLKKGLMNIAKGQLTKSNPLTGVMDPEGDSNYQRFMVFFLDEYKKQKEAGKSPQELLNPESKDYLGKIIPQYKRTPQEVMRSMVNQMKQTPSNGGLSSSKTSGETQPPAPKENARQPGESPQDYLKRMKGNK